jgi:hypothetical protein
MIKYTTLDGKYLGIFTGEGHIVDPEGQGNANLLRINLTLCFTT